MLQALAAHFSNSNSPRISSPGDPNISSLIEFIHIERTYKYYGRITRLGTATEYMYAPILLSSKDVMYFMGSKATFPCLHHPASIIH